MNLFVAIFQDNIQEIKNIISSNPSLIEKTLTTISEMDELYASCNRDHSLGDPKYHEETPLLFAARLGRLDVCKILVELGADINAINNYGHNAYMCALDNTDANIHTALYLLDQPMLNLKHTTYGKYDALLQTIRAFHHYYGTEAEKASEDKVTTLIQSLLEKGFDINEKQGACNDSPLTIACSHQSWWIVVFLISLGADYNHNSSIGAGIKDSLTMNAYLSGEIKKQIKEIILKNIEIKQYPFGKLSF